jgi:hypothetical protein
MLAYLQEKAINLAQGIAGMVRIESRFRGPNGTLNLLSPCKWDGSFEPEIISKRQVKITSDFDQKISG